MRKKMTGVVVAGVVLIAGAAMAQTVSSAPEPSSWSIIPVTGPSGMPSGSIPAMARPEVVPAAARGETVTTEGAGKPTADREPATTATRRATRTAKAVHKPAGKTTVKKATGLKHVARTTAAPKTTHVAAVKRRPPAHHAAVSKPIPVTKRQPVSRNGTTAQPVLPRV